MFRHTHTRDRSSWQLHMAPKPHPAENVWFYGLSVPWCTPNFMTISWRKYEKIRKSSTQIDFSQKKNLSRYSHWLAKTVPPFPIWVSWLPSTSRRQAARSSLQLMGSSRRAFPDPTGHMEKWHGKLHGKLCRLDRSPIFIHTDHGYSWIFMDLFNDWTWNHRIWAQTKESQSIFATCGYKGEDPLTIIQGYQGL